MTNRNAIKGGSASLVSVAAKRMPFCAGKAIRAGGAGSATGVPPAS